MHRLRPRTKLFELSDCCCSDHGTDGHLQGFLFWSDVETLCVQCSAASRIHLISHDASTYLLEGARSGQIHLKNVLDEQARRL